MPEFNKTLTKLFNKRVPRYNTSISAATTSTDNSTVSQPSRASSPLSSSTSTFSVSEGAIAGGTIGGLIGAVIICVTAYKLIRSNHGRRNQVKSPQASLENYHHGSAGSLGPKVEISGPHEIHSRESSGNIIPGQKTTVEADGNPLIEADNEHAVFELPYAAS